MPNSNLDQGRYGGARKGSSGSHLDDTGEGGARRGRSGNHLDQNPNNTTNKTSGDHLNPPRAGVAGRKTAERGGHSRTGHDHVNPSRAKHKSGSHLEPHNLKK